MSCKVLFQSVGLASLSTTRITPPIRIHTCRLRHRHDSSQYAAVPLRQVPIHSATFPRASRSSADVDDCSGDVSQSKLEKLFWGRHFHEPHEPHDLSPAFRWMCHSRYEVSGTYTKHPNILFLWLTLGTGPLGVSWIDWISRLATAGPRCVGLHTDPAFCWQHWTRSHVAGFRWSALSTCVRPRPFLQKA